MANVQVRDVPDEVVALLKMRAAQHGQSLQRFLLDVLAGEAEVASNAVLLDEAANDPTGYAAGLGETSELVQQGRRDRESKLSEPPQ